MDFRFAFEGQTERLIAAGRVVLASFSLLAIWLDPTTPSRYASIAYPLLIAYVLYAAVVVIVVWASHGALVRLRVATHVVDLIMFSLFMYFIEGPTSPFFAYFVFAIVCATLRWQWHGTLWTAVAVLAAFLGIGFYASEILQDPAFEVDRFIIRSVYLAVVAALLGYLGAYESQRRNQLAQLAAWSRTPLLALEKVVNQVLEQAVSITKAPRLLLIWEESEEPWLHVVTFSNGQPQWSREPPGSFDAIVAPSLEGKSFFCPDIRTSTAVIVDASSSEVRHWQGEPVPRNLVERFAMKSLLSVNMLGENLKGRLFFLDKPSPTPDDIILAEVVAGQAAVSMDHFYFSQRLQQLAVREERMRLAHDLHDGVLQSLTATGLQLQAALQVLDANPVAVRVQLGALQDLIFQEQRDLRSFVEELKFTTLPPSETDFKVGQLLGELAKRLERQWGFHVELTMTGPDAQVQAAMGREIYSVVREALVNAARHSQGSMARAQVEVEDQQVSISVCDDGVGFPFRGCFMTLPSQPWGSGRACSRAESLLWRAR